MITLFITMLSIGFCAAAAVASESVNFQNDVNNATISAKQAVALQIVSTSCSPVCKPGRFSKRK